MLPWVRQVVMLCLCIASRFHASITACIKYGDMGVDASITCGCCQGSVLKQSTSAKICANITLRLVLIHIQMLSASCCVRCCCCCQVSRP
jgi:hypothetical protein